jgi:hypothetical protein
MLNAQCADTLIFVACVNAVFVKKHAENQYIVSETNKKGKNTCKIQKNVVTLQPKCKYKQN